MYSKKRSQNFQDKCDTTKKKRRFSQMFPVLKIAVFKFLFRTIEAMRKPCKMLWKIIQAISIVGGFIRAIYLLGNMLGL